MQYLNDTEHATTYTTPTAAEGSIVLPETAAANDLIFVKMSALGGGISGRNDECVITDNVGGTLLPIYNHDGAADTDTALNSTLGSWARYKVAVGGEDTLTYDVDNGIQTTELWAHVVMFRPDADEEWTVDSVNPHGQGTLPAGGGASNDHAQGKTGTAPQSMVLGEHGAGGGATDEENYLGFTGYETGLRIIYTVLGGMLAGGINDPSGWPAAYTLLPFSILFDTTTYIRGRWGYELDATSEPAETVQTTGYAGSRQQKTWRWVFPYSTVAPPVSPDFFTPFEFERANARALPYYLNTGMVRDAE